MRVWVLLALVAAACSPDVKATTDAPVAVPDAPPGPDPNDGARSGTRLKLTWFQLADGTKQWDGFYDAQRKETCYVYDNWIDGRSYCTPDYDGSIEYTNATCTQKVVEVYKDPNCPRQPLPYALEWSYTPCDSRPAHLYSIGNKITVGQYYFKGSDGSCNGPYTTSTSFDYYAVGTEIPTTDLVEVTLGSPTGPGRLALRFYESADGMRRQATVHDGALGTDCYPQTHGTTDTGACSPSAQYVGDEENATCTTPKLAISKQCAQPKYAVYYPNNACPGDPAHYYAVGAATTGSPLYYYNGSTCVAETPLTTDNFYKMGSELSLAPVTRMIGTAGQRIQLEHFTDTEGLSYRSYGLFDAQKGADCYPTKLPDGTIRCVVYGGYVRTLYKDTGCTQTIDLVETTTGGSSCAAQAVPKFARKYITPPAGSCTYNTQVYQVGALYTGAVYENTGSCVAYSRSTRQVYSLGAQVPLTDFVTASITIDP